MRSMLILLAVLASSAASAQVKFRVPLTILDTQCAGGRCYPTAYYDTNRNQGWRSDYACSTNTYNQHDGVDYGIGGWEAMDAGRDVRAAADGQVVAVQDGEFDRCTNARCGHGNYIIIQHSDGKQSWYWHLKKWSIKVKLWQWVKCGAYIAKVGSSGNSTGPHLHFGVVVPGYGPDDPYGSPGGKCGGAANYWVQQGAYNGLPGYACQ